MNLGVVNCGCQFDQIKGTQYKKSIVSKYLGKGDFRRDHHLNQQTKKVCPHECGWAPSNQLQAGRILIPPPPPGAGACFLSSFPTLGHLNSRLSGPQILGLTSAAHQAFRPWS